MEVFVLEELCCEPFLSCINILQNDYTEESEALNFKLSQGQEDLLWDY